MSDRIYCGNGKEKKFDNGGSIVTITVDLDTLIREFPNYGFTTDQGKRKIRLKVAERREVDSYGNSHLVEVDTYKPTSKPGGGPQSSNRESHGNTGAASPRPLSVDAKGDEETFVDDEFTDDIPFD